MNEQRGILTTIEELIGLKAHAKGLLKSQRSNAATLGGHLSRLKGRGMDFAEVRAYQAGDDIRHMDWRVTAKTGKAHTKLYQEERERPVYFIVDFNPFYVFRYQSGF